MYGTNAGILDPYTSNDGRSSTTSLIEFANASPVPTRWHLKIRLEKPVRNAPFTNPLFHPALRCLHNRKINWLPDVRNLLLTVSVFFEVVSPTQENVWRFVLLFTL